MQQVVATAFGCPEDKVHVCATDTDIMPNGGSGVTGGSIGSEGACAAAELACEELLQRLGHAGPQPPTTEEFTKMVSEANGIFGIGHEGAVMKGGLARKAAGETDLGPTTKLNLTATSIWNPPFADTFSGAEGGSEGSIVSYFTLGAACSEVEVDILSGADQPRTVSVAHHCPTEKKYLFCDGGCVSFHAGETVVHRTDILFDAGHSMNPVIDIGQAEGAFVMGQGFFTQEETIYQKDGTLTSDSTWCVMTMPGHPSFLLFVLLPEFLVLKNGWLTIN